MPSDQRQHAKIVSFVDYTDMIRPRPLNPVDGAVLARLGDAARRLVPGGRFIQYETSMRVRLSRAEQPTEPTLFEYRTLKRREAQPCRQALPFSSHMYHFFAECANSCAACKQEYESLPTSWGHLLRDEGLG